MSAQLEQMESSTALAPAQRAAIALDSAKHRKELAELVKKSAGIVAVLNTDAREEAHRAGMVLKNTRVAIQKRGKEAREDATAFSKAVIAEEKALIDMISPEEERVLALRDEWDAKVEAERQAKIEAERQRVAAIQDRIEAIREHGPDAAHSTMSADIALILDHLEKVEVTAEVFQEMTETAEKVKAETLVSVRASLRRCIEREAEAARLKAEQEAEAARLKAEREELARLRAEQEARLAEERRRLQAEQEEVATKARAEQEAAQAALQAERDRMNSELAVERERLAKEQAALEAERRAAETAKREAEERERLNALEAALKLQETAKAEKPAAVAAPSDEEIIRVVANHFGVSVEIAYGWLLEMSKELEYL